MAFLNVTRVTVARDHNENDLFSFTPLIELQDGGVQIVQTRCGHYMAEEGLADWAQTLLGQEQVVNCPICRTNLMDRQFQAIYIGGRPEVDLEQEVVVEREKNPLAGILLFGGAMLFTVGFLGYLMGSGFLAQVNPDEPIKLDQLKDAVLGIIFKYGGEVGMTLGGTSAFIGGTSLIVSNALDFAAQKTQEVAQRIYNWFRG